MRKKLPKLFIWFFLAVFIIQIAVLFILLFTPAIAGAQVEFTPQVQVGDYVGGTVDANSIGAYISAIYKYGIGVVGIVAAVVMMFGGLLWLTSGGDSGRVGEAKEWIKASLLGLILALLSYTILLTINPDLVNFRPITVTPVKKIGYVSPGGKEFKTVSDVLAENDRRMTALTSDTVGWFEPNTNNFAVAHYTAEDFENFSKTRYEMPTSMMPRLTNGSSQILTYTLDLNNKNMHVIFVDNNTIGSGDKIQVQEKIYKLTDTGYKELYQYYDLPELP